MFAIETTVLRKQFGGLVAVDDLNLRVERGSIFGLLGPNGAGKSTVLRLLTTLLAPSSGAALVCGHDIQRASAAVRRAIGLVPQGHTSDPDLTAAENLRFYAGLFRLSGREREQRGDRLLREMDLFSRKDELVRHFSGGMRRRLEIALGLIHQPQVLFLDEPAAGLDPASRRRLWGVLLDLRDRLGLTIVLTTHQMDEGEQLCDEVAIVNHGRLVVQGAPAKLKERAGPMARTLEDVYLRYTEE